MTRQKTVKTEKKKRRYIMIISKKLTKLLLGLTFAGIIGISSGDIIGQTLLHQDTTVHAASHRQWEYRTLRRGAGYIRQRRSVIKGYYRNVGWVYSSVGPWQTY
ncbi:hypothetical protein [Streptococcus mutans]|uniref:hypothetical protein n=1 Tax=Streptococcus mutans TaxID=1309 RepID=UPI00214DBCE8|nr:hypothetical protein [Streptococcus mutans]